jgi:hypothetical protein
MTEPRDDGDRARLYRVDQVRALSVERDVLPRDVAAPALRLYARSSATGVISDEEIEIYVGPSADQGYRNLRVKEL